MKKILSPKNTVSSKISVSSSSGFRDNIIQSYTGTYEQSNGKLMKIEKEGNALKVSGDGLPTAVVYPESNNKFFLDGYDVQLVFPDTNSLIVIESGKQVLKVNRK